MEAVLELLEKSKETCDRGDRIKKAFDQYKTIFHLSRQLNETQDTEKILSRLINILEEVIRFRAVALLFKEKFSEDFYLHREYRMTDDMHRQLKWLERSGYIKWACDAQQVMLIPVQDFEEIDDPVVLIPLYSGKEIFGVLVIFLMDNSHEITTRETDLLFLTGTQAAIALENARLYQEMALQNQAIGSMKNFFESSLESMADGLLAIGLDNRISLFNSSASELFGPTPVEAVGSDFHEIFSDDFSQFIEHALKMTLTMGNFEEETDYQHPVTRRQFPLSLRMSLLRNEQNEHVGVIAVCRDVSERKELVNLRRLEQMKNEFISSVSHELRTPLTAIKSFTEILLHYEQPDEKTQKEFLQIIEKETNRLIELINDLLDISRISRDDFELDLGIIDIKEALEESLTSLQVLAEQKSITIEEKLDRQHLEVYGDYKRLVQVFVNLISNAIKFSPEGGKIEIWSEQIRGKRLMDRGDYLVVAVKDYGIGIPKEAQKAVFEKFKQVCVDPSTKPEGSGLGLAICKRIIDMLGGNIWVESEVDKGSTFYFTLPLANQDII